MSGISLYAGIVVTLWEYNFVSSWLDLIRPSLIGAVLLEINDDWVIQSRYMQIEGMAELAAMSDKNDVIAIPPKAA